MKYRALCRLALSALLGTIFLTQVPAHGAHGTVRYAGASTADAGVGSPAEVGQWSAPVNIGGIAIHAVLTHVGDVLFFQYVEGDPTVDHTSYVGTWNYLTGETRLAAANYHRDFFCAGTNVLPDGRVFVAGGHDHMTGKRQDYFGARETDVYDPVTRTWTPAPLLSAKRWYPTNVGLPDGRTLVFGGGEEKGKLIPTVDSYSATTNTMTQLPSTATKSVGLYPRMHLLTTGKIIKTGPARGSWYFDPGSNAWSGGPAMQYGNRHLGGSVLLPGLKKVLAFGGRSAAGAPATAAAEILDTSRPNPRWSYTASMNFARLHANAVVMPDGKIAVIGGGTTNNYDGPVKTTEIFDPVRETWAVMAAQQGGRMYHSTALLLPDGRILSAGQDRGEYAKTAEIFSPPYLFWGPRPVIDSAPTAAAYGANLRITSREAEDISTVALVRPGSITHQVDTDQRYVQLDFTSSRGVISATAPPNSNVAPPGYYMLFLVDSAGVPSVASWVKVG